MIGTSSIIAHPKIIPIKVQTIRRRVNPIHTAAVPNPESARTPEPPSGVTAGATISLKSCVAGSSWAVASAPPVTVKEPK